MSTEVGLGDLIRDTTVVDGLDVNIDDKDKLGHVFGRTRGTEGRVFGRRHRSLTSGREGHRRRDERRSKRR